MFNATPEEQRRCADDMIRWIEEGELKPLVGRTFPLVRPRAKPSGSSRRTRSKGGR